MTSTRGDGSQGASIMRQCAGAVEDASTTASGTGDGALDADGDLPELMASLGTGRRYPPRHSMNKGCDAAESCCILR